MYDNERIYIAAPLPPRTENPITYDDFAEGRVAGQQGLSPRAQPGEAVLGPAVASQDGAAARLTPRPDEAHGQQDKQPAEQRDEAADDVRRPRVVERTGNHCVPRAE